MTQESDLGQDLLPRRAVVDGTASAGQWELGVSVRQPVVKGINSAVFTAQAQTYFVTRPPNPQNKGNVSWLPVRSGMLVFGRNVQLLAGAESETAM